MHAALYPPLRARVEPNFCCLLLAARNELSFVLWRATARSSSLLPSPPAYSIPVCKYLIIQFQCFCTEQYSPRSVGSLALLTEVS